MNQRIVLGTGILVGAALPRLLHLAFAPPFFTTEYWELAGNLLQHGKLGFRGGQTAAYEPLYPLFLAVSRGLTGDHVQLVQMVQALVDAAGAVYLYLLAEALTRQRSIAVLAAVLHAIHPTLIRHAVAPGEFSLMSTLLIAFAYTVVTATGPRRGAIAGVWLGLAILTRTMAVPLIALAAAVLVRGGRPKVAAVVAATALAVSSLLPIRNYRLNGSILPTRNGVNLFIGNSEYSPALIPDHSPDVLQEYARSIARQHGLAVTEFGIEDERAADRLFTRLAIDELKKEPGPILWLKVRNLAYFFWPRLVPSHVLTGCTTVALAPAGQFRIENSPPRPRIEEIAYTTSYGFLAAAAIVGLWRRGRDARGDLILWSIVLTFLAAGVVYFPATRYRAPTEFVLLILRGCWARVAGEASIAICGRWR